MFYLVIILFGVAWIMLSIIRNYSNKKSPISHKYLNHGIISSRSIASQLKSVRRNMLQIFNKVYLSLLPLTLNPYAVVLLLESWVKKNKFLQNFLPFGLAQGLRLYPPLGDCERGLIKIEDFYKPTIHRAIKKLRGEFQIFITLRVTQFLQSRWILNTFKPHQRMIAWKREKIYNILYVSFRTNPKLCIYFLINSNLSISIKN